MSSDGRSRVVTIVLPDLGPSEAEALIACFEQLMYELWHAYQDTVWPPSSAVLDEEHAVIDGHSADPDDSLF